MNEQTLPCEGCGRQVAERDALIDRVPGYGETIILVWCPECQKDDGGYA